MKKRIVDAELVKKIKQNAVCCVCRLSPVDAHHLRSRGARGDDLPWNLVPLCRKHHNEVHNLGLIEMCRRHLGFFQALEIRGWFIEHGKYIHPALREGENNQEPGANSVS